MRHETKKRLETVIISSVAVLIVLGPLLGFLLAFGASVGEPDDLMMVLFCFLYPYTQILVRILGFFMDSGSAEFVGFGFGFWFFAGVQYITYLLLLYSGKKKGRLFYRAGAIAAIHLVAAVVSIILL